MSMNTQDLQYTLFSFRRCPYAIRARLSLLATKTPFKLIEVSLKNKPQELLDLSAKGTVPVLYKEDPNHINQDQDDLNKNHGINSVNKNHFVLEESLDIMNYFLKSHHHPWVDYTSEQARCSQELIEQNDHVFKKHLDRYKYPNRFSSSRDEQQQLHLKSLDKALEVLLSIESRLKQQRYLLSQTPTMVDQALFPFIRQFHHVNTSILKEHHLEKTLNWLERLTQQPLFNIIMDKKFIGIDKEGRTLFS